MASTTQNDSIIQRCVGDFSDYRDALLEEIADRGIILTFHAHIADMLRRTATVVGVEKVIYRHAEIVGFCKADVSHHMLAANPNNIIYCPQTIMIYELVSEPGIIFMTYRRAGANAAAAQALVADIVAQVVQLSASS